MRKSAKASAAPATASTEPAELALVSRADLWAIAKAARVFHNRCMNGRMEGKYFEAAAERLECALQQ